METHVNNIAKAAGGINPAIITAILAFISQMLAGCTPPAPIPPAPASPNPWPVSDLVANSFRNRFAMDKALFANKIRPRSAVGEAIIAAFAAEAPSVTQADANEFLAMV